MNGGRPRIRFGDPSVSRDLAALPLHGQHGGEGVLETVPLDRIDVDPDNARFVGRVTPEEIRAHREGRIDLSKDEYEERRAFFETLQGLAESIEHQGLLQPIVVAPLNGRYRIIAGERRFLAHLLLGRESIRAIVRPNPGDAQSLTLWGLAENLQREDLCLAEILEVVERIGMMLEVQHGRMPTWSDFHGVMHKSKRQCGRYAALYRASPEIKARIRSGEIQNMAALDLAEAALKKEKKPAKASIGLGQVHSTHVLSRIIQGALDGLGIQGTRRKAFLDVDWDDPVAARGAWKRFLKLMEEERG